MTGNGLETDAMDVVTVALHRASNRISSGGQVRGDTKPPSDATPPLKYTLRAAGDTRSSMSVKRESRANRRDTAAVDEVGSTRNG